MSNETQENIFFQTLSNPVYVLICAFFLLTSALAWGGEVSGSSVGGDGDVCAAWNASQDPKLQEAIWANKDGEEDEDEIEVVIDGHPLQAPQQPPTSAMDCLCRLQLRDDHGDVFPCATALQVGQIVSGRLEAFDGDRRTADRDLFVVSLWGQDGGEVLVRWSWSTEGAAGLRLLDAAGRPQAVFRGSPTWDDSTVQQQRLRLPSGLYFLEMRSAAPREGAYAMVMEILD